MIEYGIMTFKGINSVHSELLPYFLFGASVLVMIGYWVKKKMGAFIVLLSVLFAYLYLTGSFSRFMG